MLFSMKQMAKLYRVGSVSIRVRDCISLLLILWLSSHSTKFVPKLCQLPCFISCSSCFVCFFLLKNINWARNQAKNIVFYWGSKFLFHCPMLEFLREVASVAAPEVPLFSKAVFNCGKAWPFLIHFLTSVLQLYCCVWVDHIIALSFHPHSIFEHRKQPCLFLGSICCFRFFRKKKKSCFFHSWREPKLHLIELLWLNSSEAADWN